jgi:hypothetical protein
MAEELLSRTQLVDDLLGGVALTLHGASLQEVWPVGNLS